MSLWWWGPAEAAAELANAPVEITPPAAHRHRMATVPTIDTGATAVLPPAAHRHRTATVPTIDTGDVEITPPAAHRHRTATVPDIDTEGIVWMSASGTVPTKLPELIWTEWWIGHEIRVRLYGTGMSFDQDTVQFADELSGELPTAGGYVSGGEELTGKDTEVIESSNRIRLLSDPVEIVVSGSLSAAFAVVIDVESGNDATSPVLSIFDFDGLKTSETIFEVAPPDDGWLYNLVSVPA